MKLFPLPIVALLILISSSFAQVAPDDPKQPPAPTPRRRAADVDFQRALADREKAEAERAVTEQDVAFTRKAFGNWKQKLEKGSYVGIATSPIPNVLRDQLKLDKGVGLVVDRVDADSPAEAAGIKISDVIQKLDDQILINPNQFGVLVRTLKPDTEVKLTLIRETKPQVITIKPVEKDLAPLDEPGMGKFGVAQPWMETTPAGAIVKGGGGGRFTITAPGTGDVVRAEVMTVNNDKMTITTRVDPNGQKHVTALDTATGKVLYDNVVENDAQLKDMPPEVAEQVKNLDNIKLRANNYRVIKGNGGVLNIGRPANNLPKMKAVSGSDDDYTWDLTTKTNEAGKPELDLLLLDKNGNKLFDGPFSRTRDMKGLPQQISDRLSSFPWDLVIEDLKSPGGGNNAVNFAPGGPGAALPAPAAPRATPVAR